MNLTNFFWGPFQTWIMRDNHFSVIGVQAYCFLGGFMLAAYLLNWLMLPERMNDGQLEHLKHNPIIFRQSSEFERRKAMNLDISLVFKDTETTFQALASGLTGMLGYYFFSFARFYMCERYHFRFETSEEIFTVSTIIVAASSFFTWIFTDCMMRKLCIFIALIITTPCILLLGHAELFGEPTKESLIMILKIGIYSFSAIFPMLNVPLIPETIHNIKRFRNTQFDNKVNDFGAAVSFAFGYTGPMIGGALVQLNYLFYFSFCYDLLLAITITFIICYSCYVNIKHTCRKDREEEEAMVQRLSQK